MEARKAKGGGTMLAIVAARSGSKGLPDKNIRPLMGRPLLEWPILAALSSEYVTKVVVSTDSEYYAEIAMQAGAEIPFIRPSLLSGDNAASADVVLHAIECLEVDGESFDYVVLLEPTSPLTEAHDIDAAHECLLADANGATSIVGISELNTHHPAYAMQNTAQGLLRPAYSENFANLPRRQDLPILHFLDGSLYMSEVEALKLNKTFYTDKTLGHKMDAWKSMEIDNMTDFICVEALMNYYRKSAHA